MRSVFVPMERVDRFDVVWEQSESDPEGTADVTSSSLLGVLSKSSTVVRASRRPRRPELG